jgi:polyadenylate-binding protein
VRRQERSAAQQWTNLYVKQFPLTWNDAELKNLFSQYGLVQSVFISKDLDGKSKGFGFVNYDNHVAASQAVSALHGLKIENGALSLYVGKAQKKIEREREIKTKLEAVKLERVTKYQNMNLYVKNIADSVTDEQFKEAFANYGNITSSRDERG